MSSTRQKYDEYINMALKSSLFTKETTVENNKDAIEHCIDALIGTLKAGNKIMVCGNGGSAADALHICGEFTNRLLMERAPLAAMPLVSDISSVTAIANDYSFDKIFSKQVRALGKKGDLLWILTTSGNSINLIKAAEVAREMGIKVLAFSGRDGGKLKGYCDLSVIAGPALDSPRIQETHVFLYHLIIEIIEEKMFGDVKK